MTHSQSSGGRGREELANQVRFLEAEVARPAPPPERRPGAQPRPRAAPRRHPALAVGGDVPERAPRPDAARGPRPDHEAQGGGRPAGPAAGRLRHVPRPQRGRLHRRLHRRPQAPRQRQPRRRARLPRAWPGGHAQRGAQRRGRPRLRAGRRGRDVQGAARRRRARPGHRQRRRGARRAPGRAAAQRHHPGRRLAAARRPRRLRLREGAQVRGRGARPRRGARHRLLARSAAWSPRSTRSATRSSCPTCTPSCSRSTSSSRPRACCSTARPAAARR